MIVWQVRVILVLVLVLEMLEVLVLLLSCQPAVCDVRVGGWIAIRRWCGRWRAEVTIAAIAFLLRRFDSVAALDHVRFEGDGSRSVVEFEEEAAGVA